MGYHLTGSGRIRSIVGSSGVKQPVLLPPCHVPPPPAPHPLVGGEGGGGLLGVGLVVGHVADQRREAAGGGARGRCLRPKGGSGGAMEPLKKTD